MTMFILFCVFDEISLNIGKSCKICELHVPSADRDTHVLCARVSKDLYWERRDEVRSEVYEMYLARCLCTF